MAAFAFAGGVMKAATGIVFLWAASALAQVSGFRPLSQPEVPKLLTKARGGNTQSQLRLGIAYQYGLGVVPDPRTAEYWLKTAAGFGDAEAQTQLGLLYLQPEFAASRAQALRWFMRAAAGGSSRAEHNIGLMYTLGIGAPVDRVEAVRWYRRAVRHGTGASRTNLGVVLVESSDPASRAEGFEILSRAASSGDVDAENALATCYQYGHGTKTDFAKAIDLYRHAAARGSLFAMKNLAAMYQNGIGVPKNPGEAFRLYQEACNAGEWRACGSVADAYLLGDGVARDQAKAYQFALMGGLEPRYIQELEKQLSESEKNRAADETERWKRVHAFRLSASPH
jgi:TPR repeat protein